mmetsp:Transcript_30539/g.83906  ORF Transcript_30539/g.83906 Transcript_30539/m.83906 type:complete len:262 (+) Transcript_30539:798-1583(+)
MPKLDKDRVLVHRHVHGYSRVLVPSVLLDVCRHLGFDARASELHCDERAWIPVTYFRQVFHAVNVDMHVVRLALRLLQLAQHEFTYILVLFFLSLLVQIVLGDSCILLALARRRVARLQTEDGEGDHALSFSATLLPQEERLLGVDMPRTFIDARELQGHLSDEVIPHEPIPRVDRKLYVSRFELIWVKLDVWPDVVLAPSDECLPLLLGGGLELLAAALHHHEGIAWLAILSSEISGVGDRESYNIFLHAWLPRSSVRVP